jgi:predicted HicB family RNase H-like nuclease
MSDKNAMFCLRAKKELLEKLKLKAIQEKISMNKLIKKKLFGEKW